MHLRCPHCQNPIEIADLPSSGEISCAGCGSSFRLEAPTTGRADGPIVQRLGKFELLTVLGHGAFGVVYKARDTELDRTVAIKIPRAGNIGSSQEDVDRFLREARAVAQLRFPSIITIHEVGLLPPSPGTPGEGPGVRAPYLVSDFVDGVTLADHLTGRRLPFRESAQLLAEVADALQYAHPLGVVHRDVKPSNIMCVRAGSVSDGPAPTVANASGSLRPMLLDFGLAKRDAGEITMTMDGHILGTPAYMSPEQARGESHHVDGRSDVYSVGVMLYQLLTGAFPFRGNKAMLLHQVLHDEPTPPRRLNDKIPRDLETIALKAMAKEPGWRYGSAKEMADDLRRWLAGEPIAARSIGTLERTWRWCKRKPAIAALSATLAAVSIIGFAIVVWQLQTSAALADAYQQKRERALAQVNALRDAAPGAVLPILTDLEANRDTVLPRLREQFAAEKERGKRMRFALALLSDDMRDDLAAWMLDVNDPAEMLLIRDVLKLHAETLTPKLRQQAEDVKRPRDERVRALAALASYDAKAAMWKTLAPDVVEDVLGANPLYVAMWMDAFRPVRESLMPTLGEVYRGKKLAEQRQVSARILADYAAEEPRTLANLLMDGDAKPFNVIYPVATAVPLVVPELVAELDKKPPPPPAAAPDDLASRQANAALALMRMQQSERVWPLLKHSPDPTVASWLIERFASHGIEASVLTKRLDNERDISTQRALLLSLGEYPRDGALIKKLQALYQEADDPGLHAAAEWLLRTWNEGDWPRQTNDAAWTKDAEGRVKRFERIVTIAKASRVPPGPGGSAARHWYVNGQG